MLRLLIALACLSVPSWFVASADAQMIRVGPWGGVRIRVPFVGVDVSPWGDTRVRAPFTHVEAPGYRYPHHYGYSGYGGYRYHTYRGYHDPHVFDRDHDVWLPQYRYDFYRHRSGFAPSPSLPYHPHNGPIFGGPSIGTDRSLDRPGDDAYRSGRGNSSGDSMSGPSPAEVAQALRSAAVRLRDDLSRRGEQGNIWLDYLQPGRIIEVIDRGESPQSLQSVLANYEGVTNAQVGWVGRLEGFAETRRLLAQFVAGGPVDRPAVEQDEFRQLGDRESPETLELPPPQPRPEGAGADQAPQADKPPGDPQSASAEPPKRFSL